MEKIGEESFVFHKGLKSNSLAAPNSLEAIVENYRGNLEFDVVLLKDGNIVVVHERDVGLTLKDIENFTIDDIEKINISRRANGNPVSVPLLKEFVALSVDADVKLFLEIKASSTEKSLNLAKKIIEQLEEVGEGQNELMEKQINFQSFSVKTLRFIKNFAQDKNKNFTIGLFWPSDQEWAKKVDLFDFTEMENIDFGNMTWHQKGIVLAQKNNFDTIEFQPFVIDEQLIKDAHDNGLMIGASVVRSEKEAKSLQDIGVDYVKIE